MINLVKKYTDLFFAKLSRNRHCFGLISFEDHLEPLYFDATS